jgi:hypothetical protein
MILKMGSWTSNGQQSEEGRSLQQKSSRSLLQKQCKCLLSAYAPKILRQLHSTLINTVPTAHQHISPAQARQPRTYVPYHTALPRATSPSIDSTAGESHR